MDRTDLHPELNMVDRRLIEESFPIREVSKESVREKNIRHGHISTLHIWWARRPLAACRATVYAALTSVPSYPSKKDEKMRFIAKLSKWENSLDMNIIQKAREDILKANGGKPPKVLDPFAGGGSIPLEALRLGCEVYAGDYNPVATLILKCTLEYPQKYGNSDVSGEHVLKSEVVRNRLLEDVKKYGNYVLNEAKKELSRFYPADPDGAIPIGYIWARTIPCQNPSCNAEIPLMRQYWLARKANRKIALYPYVEGREVRFKVVGDGYEPFPEGFDPSKGSIKKAKVTCLVCGSSMSDKTVRSLFQRKKSSERLIAVVLYKECVKGKRYRIANDNDIKAFKEAEEYLAKKREELMNEWGIDPIPDEYLPPSGTLGFRVQRYNMNTWGNLFNARQKLALITFVEKVRQSYKKMIEEGYEEGYTKAVMSYLALGVSRTTDFETNLCRWHPQWEFIPNTFARQALPMSWDYAELNTFSPILTGTFESMLRQIVRVVEVSKSNNSSGTAIQSSATSLPYVDNYFDAIITDPPYYDNVPYSYLSDFFYVWLKRVIGDLYPDLFVTPLTPKEDEIVAYSNIPGGYEAGRRRFEEKLTKAFKEIHRVLKQNGIAVIIFAHKSTTAWETLINALLQSGLTITGAWPVHTEMQKRLRAQGSAALASSIHIVARKINRKEVGFYRELKDELREHLIRRLESLWNEGITGADLLIAAIGSSIEIFGRYEKVIDAEGNEIKADRLLDDVRKIVTEYAIRQIMHDGLAADLSPLTRFYVLYRWAYQDNIVHFDDARKLAQGVGLDITELNKGSKGFIKKEKEFVQLLGPQDRDIDSITVDMSSTNRTDMMIDVLHKVVLLWKEDKKRDEMLILLSETGFGKRDVFYRVAQAIAESLPEKSEERKLIEGFLASKEMIIRSLRERDEQTKVKQVKEVKLDEYTIKESNKEESR